MRCSPQSGVQGVYWPGPEGRTPGEDEREEPTQEPTRSDRRPPVRSDLAWLVLTRSHSPRTLREHAVVPHVAHAAPLASSPPGCPCPRRPPPRCERRPFLGARRKEANTPRCRPHSQPMPQPDWPRCVVPPHALARQVRTPRSHPLDTLTRISPSRDTQSALSQN